MLPRSIPSSSSAEPTHPPPSKKRKADQLEGLTGEQEEELRALRAVVAAVDTKLLQEYVLKQFDKALASFNTSSLPSSAAAAPLSAVATSTSATSTQGPHQQRPDDNRLGGGNQNFPPGAIDQKGSADALSVINALSLVFSNLTSQTPTDPSSLPQSPIAATSVETPSNTITSPTPPNSLPRRQVPSTRMEESSEEHCVRCHQDFDSSSKEAICMIEHDLEDCQRIAKYGQASSRWKYGCCGYEFDSPYCDEPEDENSDTDKAQYCFVGRHTIIEAVAHSRKLNTYSCADLGCWEDEEEMAS